MATSLVETVEANRLMGKAQEGDIKKKQRPEGPLLPSNMAKEHFC